MNFTTTKFALMQALFTGAPLILNDASGVYITLQNVTAVELESGGQVRCKWNVTVSHGSGKKNVFVTTID